MEKVYFELIKKGLWTIENVPMTWKDKTQALIDADLVE